MNLFEKWEQDVEAWREKCKNGEATHPPKKPKGYDAWRQGVDPLNLRKKQTIQCKGGSLVPRDWIRSHEKELEPTQQQFNL